MNQILLVNLQRRKGDKENKASINSILKVFAIFLIIFGLGMTGTGAYGFYKNINESAIAARLPVSKPLITIERESAALINIVVTHDSGISKLTYTINDDDPVEVPGNGELELEKEVELSDGTSSLIVIAEDINGIEETYETSIIVEQSATITLSQEAGKIKALIDSKTGLDYIEYYWDDNEQNATHEAVSDNSAKTEKLIDVLEGEHVLTIKAVDIEGKQTTKTQKVLGDNKPDLDITTDGVRFFINAKDDEGLTKIEIMFNEGQVEVKQISGTEYNEAIVLQDGENKLKVRVYNKNGLFRIKGVIFGE